MGKDIGGWGGRGGVGGWGGGVGVGVKGGVGGWRGGWRGGGVKGWGVGGRGGGGGGRGRGGVPDADVYICIYTAKHFTLIREIKYKYHFLMFEKNPNTFEQECTYAINVVLNNSFITYVIYVDFGRHHSFSTHERMFSGKCRRVDVVWCGVCGVVWCVDIWSDMMWCDVMWCDVMWCNVMWYDVMWYDMIYDVMWCDVMCDVKIILFFFFYVFYSRVWLAWPDTTTGDRIFYCFSKY